MLIERSNLLWIPKRVQFQYIFISAFFGHFHNSVQREERFCSSFNCKKMLKNTEEARSNWKKWKTYMREMRSWPRGLHLNNELKLIKQWDYEWSCDWFLWMLIFSWPQQELINKISDLQLGKTNTPELGIPELGLQQVTSDRRGRSQHQQVLPVNELYRIYMLASDQSMYRHVQVLNL